MTVKVPNMPRMSDRPVSSMKAIREYFFSGANKVPMAEFNAEWKKLTAADRIELGELICAETGDILAGK